MEFRMKNKKTILVSALALSLTGCGGNIDLVKDGTIDFNKSITVGQSLDNWNSCEERSWDEFTTDNGQ